MSQRGCLLIIVDLGSNSKFIFAVQRNLQGLQKEKMRERNHVHPKVKDNDKRSKCGQLLHTQGDLSAVVAELGPEVEIMSSSKKW